MVRTSNQDFVVEEFSKFKQAKRERAISGLELDTTSMDLRLHQAFDHLDFGGEFIESFIEVRNFMPGE